MRELLARSVLFRMAALAIARMGRNDMMARTRLELGDLIDAAGGQPKQGSRLRIHGGQTTRAAR